MNTYTVVHANGSVDIVKGCKLEYNKVTGQTMIYATETLCSLYCLVAVAPATSFVREQDEPKKQQREFANIETSKDV